MSEPSSRRTFLGQTTALSLGASLAGAIGNTFAAGEKSSERRIKKTLKFDMIKGDMPLVDKFKMITELGYDGVELYPGQLDQKEVVAARDAAGTLIPGLVYATSWKTTFSSPDPKMRTEAVEGLKAALREAKVYGTTSVLVIAAVVNKEVAYADAYKRSQEELAKAIPTAEETGVVIACENVWNNFLLSPLEAARFIDEINSPWVRWYFDIGNVVYNGWPEHWISILGKRIFKLDIKDFSRKKQNEEGMWKGFVDLGDGDVDWAAVNKALHKIDYTGWGGAEVAGGDRERLKELSAKMDRVLSM